VNDDGGLTASGAISGIGPFLKIGTGRVTFAGTRANTYIGGTQALNGDLRLNKNNGINAIPGDGLVGTTPPSFGRVHLTPVADEQIPDSATIELGANGTLGVAAHETVGPLIITGGARVQTSAAFTGLIRSTGTLILAGDITIRSGTNDASISGDI